MNLRDRYRPIAFASNILVTSSFVVLVILLLAERNLGLVNVALGSAIILIANVLFIASAMAVPSLLGDGSVRFPLNFTLPLVFCGWGIVASFLAWRLGNPLEPTLPAFRKFSEIFGPLQIAAFPLAQIVALSLAICFTRETGSGRVESP
jgi:hypothetical protein